MHLRSAVAAVWLAGAGTALPDDGASIGRAAPAVERVAVLPFRGAPEFRRPCEEAVALALRRASGLVIVTPFDVSRALAGAPQAGREEKPPSFDAEDASAPSAEEARQLARWLGVDVLVSGCAARASLEIPEVVVVLLAGSSGELLAQRREGGSAWWPIDDLVGEAAAEATRAADGILEALGRSAPPRKPSVESTPRRKSDL
jgi:hypothetical protein